jgi:ATP-dependent exoDNAse (exonuclease V) alpha subunit
MNKLENVRTLRTISRDMLRDKQLIAFYMISYIIDRHPDNNNITRGFILTGGAGCGKSFVIDAICTKYSGRVKLMAPSGKASCNIGGETVHSTFHIGIKGSNNISSDNTRAMQNDFSSIDVIICDEYTMLNCNMLALIDLRCRLAKNKRDVSFGGMTIILVGDPGQLPPVSGKPLWTKSADGASINEICGSGLYRSFFKYGITLEGSNRLENNEHKPFFESFLNNLRNGNVTYEQFQQINSLTSEEFHVRRLQSHEEFKRRFYGPNSTWYFNTNEEILLHNLKMLKFMGTPICRINADHSSAAAFKGNEEQTKRLSTVMYIGVNSKVMLTWNLCTHNNLVNGSTGIVKDIIFDEGSTPPDKLPITIVVEFPQYRGPAFFNNVINEDGSCEDRSKWVPILPVVATWTKTNASGKKESLYRKQFPLVLSWAYTAWKGQGTTNYDECSMNPGDADRSPGVCYVMLSRVTSIFNLHIPGGLSFERLTDKIKAHKGLQLRIEEEARLAAMQQQTIEFYNRHRNIFVENKENNV